MGACVVNKKHTLKNQHQLPMNDPKINDLKTHYFEQPSGEKTVRAFNKQSFQQMKQFMEEGQPKITSDWIGIQTGKQIQFNFVYDTQKQFKDPKLLNRQSFCSSVQRQFDAYESISQYEKQQTQMIQLNKDKQEENIQNLNETADTKNQTINQTCQMPIFLRKYLPMQQNSIEIQYL